jgi:hypothetical protein
MRVRRHSRVDIGYLIERLEAEGRGSEQCLRNRLRGGKRGSSVGKNEPSERD